MKPRSNSAASAKRPLSCLLEIRQRSRSGLWPLNQAIVASASEANAQEPLMLFDHNRDDSPRVGVGIQPLSNERGGTRRADRRIRGGMEPGRHSV